MNSNELIQIARECADNYPSAEFKVIMSYIAIVEFAQRIEQPYIDGIEDFAAKQRISELEKKLSIEMEKVSVLANERESLGIEDEQKAIKLWRAKQRIADLESTIKEGIEQVERFGAKNFRQKQRIAELEKDCEILQTNLDAALRANHAQINNCEVAYKYAFDMRDFVIARDAEIERLRSALKNLLDDTQHKDHVCSEEWCPVSMAKEALKGVAE